MTLIVPPRNRKEEKVLKAILNSLSIGFHPEAEEDAAFFNAMQKGRKTALLNKAEKTAFLKRLKQAK